MKQTKSLLQYISFPAWLVIISVFVFYILRSGMKPVFILMSVTTASFAFATILERLIPYRTDWKNAKGDLLADASNFGIIAFVVDPMMKIAGAATAAWIATTLSPFGFPLFPRNTPLLIQIALVFLIGEFGKYWIHRWHHQNRFLWSVHSMHHSLAHLYSLNTFRLHPLNYAFMYWGGIFPLILIKTPVEPLVIYFAFIVTMALFQHANIDFKLGPLNYIFSTNVLHRWHHSDVALEGNRNYGGALIIWDLLFGTFYFPDNATCPEQLGVGDPNYPAQSYLKQYTFPFKSSNFMKPGEHVTLASARKD